LADMNALPSMLTQFLFDPADQVNLQQILEDGEISKSGLTREFDATHQNKSLEVENGFTQVSIVYFEDRIKDEVVEK